MMGSATILTKYARQAYEAIGFHYREGNIDWIMLPYMILVHILALIGIFVAPHCKTQTLLFAFLLWPISGFGITIGAHRLWAHRTFEAAWPVRFVLMICNSIANQRSIYHWVRDHRIHHKYSETDADPHNAMRGFVFAHIGWLVLRNHPDVVKAYEEMDMSDLQQDSVVMMQKWVFPWFGVYMSLFAPAQFAVRMWGEDWWLAFFVASALRYCFVLHCTFLVNSAAHLWGDHPYDVLSYPAENPLVSFFAIGEGWHNWHHKYPFDYAASEFGVSRQFNPSKLVIDFLAMFGLVWGRRRATTAWTLGRKRRDRDATNGVVLPRKTPRPWEYFADYMVGSNEKMEKTQ